MAGDAAYAPAQTPAQLRQELPAGLPIGPGWVDAAGSEDVTFPFDGTVIGQAPVADEAIAEQALDHAVRIAPQVGRMASHTRRAVLTRTRELLTERRDAFEQLLVLETGKPLVDCRVELDRTLLTLDASAEEVARIHGETVPLDLLPSGDGLTGFWTRKPIGVVIGIAGFNYPLLLVTHKIAPALAAGCPVIAKPAPQTPLATLWFVHLVRQALSEADAPTEAVQVVSGGAEVGECLTTDPRIGAVSFTGSAAIGHTIARAAAPKKVLLELGSNAALVVCADADLDAAADAVARGGFYASGQACISVQRVLVAEPVRDDFVERLRARLRDIRIGDPRDPATQVSALIDERSTERVNAWIDSATSAGATVLAGGEQTDRVLHPTVLLDVPTDEDAWREEVFGPVVGIRTVADLDEAIDTVNASRYGLHVSVYTASLESAFEAIDRIEAGGVVVNEVPGFRSDVMPYGGVKDSGTGREGPRFAIEELTVTRMAILRTRTSKEER